jgi:hypothetical protein
VPATGPSRRLPEQRSRQTAEVVISRSDRPRKWPELHRRR